MAASVTVHHKAFGDSRIVYLGTLLGCDDDAALGRMTRLWSVCTERQTSTPEPHEIRACLRNARGDELLIESGLAERLTTGAIRVRGCEGMIEWFGATAEAATPAARAAGGRARSSKAKRDALGRMLPAGDAGGVLDESADAGSSNVQHVQQTPAIQIQSLSSPDLGSPSPSSGASSRDLPGDPQQEAPTPAPTPRTPPPGIPQPGTARPDPRVKLNWDAWAYAALKHAEIRDEIAPNALPFPAMPGGDPMRELAARTREVLEQTGDPPNFEKARETVKRRIDVAVAEAKREQHLKWFTPSRIWDSKSFWRALEVTPEEAFVRRATERAGPHSVGPRGSPPPAPTPDPPRRIKTLT